jgi:hypothetical protein
MSKYCEKPFCAFREAVAGKVRHFRIISSSFSCSSLFLLAEYCDSTYGYGVNLDLFVYLFRASLVESGQKNKMISYSLLDRYRSRGPVSIPGATRYSEK